MVMQANKLGGKADKLGSDVGSAASNLSGNPAQQALNKVFTYLADNNQVWPVLW